MGRAWILSLMCFVGANSAGCAGWSRGEIRAAAVATMGAGAALGGFAVVDEVQRDPGRGVEGTVIKASGAGVLFVSGLIASWIAGALEPPSKASERGVAHTFIPEGVLCPAFGEEREGGARVVREAQKSGGGRGVGEEASIKGGAEGACLEGVEAR